MSDSASFLVFVFVCLTTNALCAHDDTSSLPTFLSTPFQRTVILYFASEVPKARIGTFVFDPEPLPCLCNQNSLELLVFAGQ